MRNSNNLMAKETFKFAFILFVFCLVVLPFATSFNEFLTKVIENTGYYKILQKLLLPYTKDLLAGILFYLPGIEVSTFPFGVVVNGVDVRITWNCLGWQSFLLFSSSIIIGLRGSYTRGSKLECLAFGIFGTFLINIFRLVFTAALVGWWRGLFVILFHNYFSTFITIIWLFTFWWFSYSFVLERKDRV